MQSTLKDKRVHFITGKGGVGKSTCAALMACMAAQMGKRVLLIDLDPNGSIPGFFNSKPLTYEPASLTKNIDGILITPHLSLKEYVTRQLKFKALTDLIFDNKIIHFFLDAAPGIEEITLMGKIFFLEGEKTGKRPRWNTLIIDSPATGHGLYLFKSPKIFIEITKKGPLTTHSKKIYDSLISPKKTAIHIVTLAEELPIQEAIELNQEIESSKLPRGNIIINKMLSTTPLQLNSGKFTSATASESLSQKVENTIGRFHSRYKIQTHYQKLLEKETHQKAHLVPWILDRYLDLKSIQDLAQRMA